MVCWRRNVCSGGLGVLLLASLPAQGNTLVQFRTTIANFDVELFDTQKPVTVRNFIRYVENGAYRDMIMHRVVTNFVIQGGSFVVRNHNTPSNTLAEILSYGPITNEFKVGQSYSNV